MNFFLTLMIITLSFSSMAEKVILTVPSIVCPMCLQGIRKSFKDAVNNPKEDIALNLETKEITLNLKKSLSDKELTKRIEDNTYNVTKIKRIPQEEVKGAK